MTENRVVVRNGEMVERPYKAVDTLEPGDIVVDEAGYAELLVEGVRVTPKTVAVTYYSGVVEPGLRGRDATFTRRYHRPENYPAARVEVAL